MAISKNAVAALGILLLAGIGATAWIHNSQSGPAPLASAIAAPNAMTDTAAIAPGPSDGYYPSVPAPIYVRQGEEPELAYEQAPPARAPRYATTYRAAPRRHHGRSKKHSIEIVAGTAAAGAAIGAIAGGGPGAAIGAISGGGAGFVYDRLTHNH
jgi:hypothetical protein